MRQKKDWLLSTKTVNSIFLFSLEIWNPRPSYPPIPNIIHISLIVIQPTRPRLSPYKSTRETTKQSHCKYVSKWGKMHQNLESWTHDFSHSMMKGYSIIIVRCYVDRKYHKINNILRITNECNKFFLIQNILECSDLLFLALIIQLQVS